MEAWEREKIMGQWGVRGESLRERRERRVLERDLRGSSLAGRPLPTRARNFRPAADSYIASLGGPLPYMVRLREIAAQTEAHERELEAAWHALAEECAGDPHAFARRWRRLAERRDFTAVNELIDLHNRFYPAESRLPMDVRRRDFALVNGEPYGKRALGLGWILDRFPPVLAAVTRA